MTHFQKGIFRASLRSIFECLKASRLLSTSSLATVILYATVSIAISLLSDSEAPALQSSIFTGILGFLLLPQQFIMYDLMLGNAAPRSTAGQLYLDLRVARYLAWFLLSLVIVFLPLALTGTLSGLLLGWSEGSLVRQISAALAGLAAASATMALCLRVMFFPLLVAKRTPRPLLASFRETKGKAWRILLAMLLPYSAVLFAFVVTEVAFALRNEAGVLGMAGLTIGGTLLLAFLTFFETTLFAQVYLRIVQPQPDADGQELRDTVAQEDSVTA